jgi:MFS family permease
VYFVVALKLTPLQFGFIEGIYQGAAVIVRLLGGVLADRWRRCREIAATGYALSAVCKLGLLAAGSAWGALSTVLLLDRLGKGIRTAPRDALISRSAMGPHLGLAFGIHRALDTAGALLGPLVAFGLLLMLPDAYDVVFVTSFCVALVGLAALLILVRNPSEATRIGSSPPVSMRAVAALLELGQYRSLVLAGAALGLVTVGDAFLYLGLSRRLDIEVSTFPLLFVGTALAYLVLAIPAGRLADRLGRTRVFVTGYVLLACACALLLVPDGGLPAALSCLALLGAYYACTDGVLMAIASTCTPTELRASALALLATATGVTRFLASLAFGALWHWWSFEIALVVFLLGLIVAIATAAPKIVRAETRLAHGRAELT